ncbi:MAG: trimethylamine methyltransferase family protein [Candidatus Hermodarchaeota archaeon]
MKLNKIKVLSKDELETIHTATLELFEKTGIKIDCKETRNLLREHGAIVDKTSDFVKFPEELVKENLKKVPSSFTLYGRDGSYNFEVTTKNTHFASIGAAVKYYEPTKKNQVRKSVLDDTIKQLRVLDQSEHLNCSQIAFWPGDVKYTTIHTTSIYNWAKNSHKPFGHGCMGKLVSQDSIKMASILVGGDEELKKRPRLFGIFNPTSPLHLPKLMTNGLSVFTKFKQPLVIAPEALGGTSAPVSLAGLLTQTNAEILSGIILAQISNPGAPVFYGTVSHTTDMHTGNSAIGGIETGLITAGMAQLAQYYNIPSRSLGGVTDSKCLDLQNGVERFQTLMFAAQAGINFITFAGTYEATLAGALELTAIDNDLAGMIKRALNGINVNEDTIGLKVIEKVATSTQKGVTYLSEKHTRKFMKEELFIPQLFDRNRRTAWRKKGSKDIIASASEKVSEILKNFKEYDITSDVDKKLKDYMKLVDQRTIDDFKLEEGLSTAGISLPNGESIKSND